MTFLNPAVLIGLLAATIPVIIHLLNLRKLKKIEFSTLSFLKEMQKNKIRKVKLKQWLLLAMRVLIIMLLVTAFSRPALRGTSIGGIASSAKTTAVFIIDDTFSMSVIGNKGSYLNHAKETAKNIVNELQEGDEAALILVSDPDTDVNATSGLSDFVNRIDDLQLSYASGYIHNAMAKAAEVISESQNYNKEIYLLSDFQENRIAVERSLSDFSEVFNQNIKLYGVNFSAKPVFNLALTDFQLQTRIFEKDKPVNFAVTIANFSNDDVTDAVVSLFTNGERSSQKSVSIKNGSSTTFDIETTLNGNGYIDYSVEIEDDEILQDNRRFLSVYLPSEIPSAIFYENEGDTRFLEIALKAAGENNPLKLDRYNISRISSINLSRFKTIAVTAGSNEGLEKIKTFVQSGGGALLFPASNSSAESFSAILNELGLGGVNGTTGKKGVTSSVNRFSKIDYDHPVFQDLFENDRKKIESPEIYYNLKINPSGKGRDIISLSDGSSFMSEYSYGNGKVIVLSSSPDLNWNNFPVKGIFPPLVYKTLLYLSFTPDRQGDYQAGDPVNISLAGKAVPQVKISRPDGTSETINHAEDDYISYFNTTVSGVYDFSSGDQVIGKISINTDPAESVTDYISEDDFEKYLENINFQGNFIKIKPSDNISEQVIQARFGSELWKIFAVLTLLLVLAEMTVARSLKKDLTDNK